MLSGQKDAGLLRIEGLHEHPAATRPATGASGHLRQQLKRPLRRAKVGNVQPNVRVHHADQNDVWKIQSFGDNLCADQEVDEYSTDSIEYCVVATCSASEVDIIQA